VVGTCHNQPLSHRITTNQNRKRHMSCPYMNNTSPSTNTANYFTLEIAMGQVRAMLHLVVDCRYESSYSSSLLIVKFSGSPDQRYLNLTDTTLNLNFIKLPTFPVLLFARKLWPRNEKSLGTRAALNS